MLHYAHELVSLLTVIAVAAAAASCGSASPGPSADAVPRWGMVIHFIRYTVAHDICARVEYEYQALSVQAAADAVVRDVLRPAGGEGGVIGIDRSGNVAVSLNVTGMGRGYMGADGSARIAFTADERFSAD